MIMEDALTPRTSIATHEPTIASVPGATPTHPSDPISHVTDPIANGEKPSWEASASWWWVCRRWELLGAGALLVAWIGWGGAAVGNEWGRQWVELTAVTVWALLAVFPVVRLGGDGWAQMACRGKRIGWCEGGSHDGGGIQATNRCKQVIRQSYLTIILLEAGAIAVWVLLATLARVKGYSLAGEGDGDGGAWYLLVNKLAGVATLTGIWQSRLVIWGWGVLLTMCAWSGVLPVTSLSQTSKQRQIIWIILLAMVILLPFAPLWFDYLLAGSPLARWLVMAVSPLVASGTVMGLDVIHTQFMYSHTSLGLLEHPIPHWLWSLLVPTVVASACVVWFWLRLRRPLAGRGRTGHWEGE